MTVCASYGGLAAPAAGAHARQPIAAANDVFRTRFTIAFPRPHAPATLPAPRRPTIGMRAGHGTREPSRTAARSARRCGREARLQRLADARAPRGARLVEAADGRRVRRVARDLGV